MTDYSSNGTFINNERMVYEVGKRVEPGTVITLADNAMQIRLS